MPHSIMFQPYFTWPYQFLKRPSRCSEEMHPLPLAWQQPVCVSLAWLAVQMFEMARVMNYGTECPAAPTSLATVFFSHSHQRLPRPDQRPPSPGLKGKHLQSCWTVLSCSINVTLSALVVRYFWAGGGRTQTLKTEEKIPLSVLKPPTQQCVGLLNILLTASWPADLLSSQSRSLNKWGLCVASQNTELGWIPMASFSAWFAG